MRRRRVGDCKLQLHSRLFFCPSNSPFITQGPKGELELNYPDLVEIKKVRKFGINKAQLHR